MSGYPKTWLSFDLSSPKGTLAIHHCHPNSKIELLTSKMITLNGDHSEKLIPTLEALLNETSISMAQIDRFITTAGPGSFTGLRIAMASLKALAYVNKTPIEILSGSEARGLKWITTQSPSDWNTIYVLTHITSERFVVAHFVVNPDNSLSLVSEKTCSDWTFCSNQDRTALLLDDRINPGAIPSNPLIKSFTFPLQASFLGETLLKASTRNCHESILDWVQLSPKYFGASQY